MKRLFTILITMLSFSLLFGQNYLPRLDGKSTHDDYFLNGNPITLYHRTFELLSDSLTGELIKGKELDTFSEFSYYINFTSYGDIKDLHYMNDGISCTSTNYYFDPEGKYCSIQIKNNIITGYESINTINYEEPKDNNAHVYKLVRESFIPYAFKDSLLLTNRDTIYCIEKDSIILSFYLPETDVIYSNYLVKDSAYYTHITDSCLNYNTPQNRTIKLYNELEQIIETIEYTSGNNNPSYRETFNYNEHGMLTLYTRYYYTTFNDFGEIIYRNKPIVDIFRYKYSENNIDKYGNWTQRQVFRSYSQEKEVPLYMECRKIEYLE